MTEFPRFYPIVDVQACAAHGMDPVRVAEACLRAGAALLQIRDKISVSAAFLDTADRIAALASRYAARLIVNDRTDLAAMAGAAGVHVGQDDMPVAAVRRLLGRAAIVGISTHDDRQVDEALGGEATYLAVGPIYATSTKETGYTPRGLDLARRAAGRGKPVVAIGGITLERVPELREAGVDALAVIGDLFAAGGPERRTREYLAALGG